MLAMQADNGVSTSRLVYSYQTTAPTAPAPPPPTAASVAGNLTATMMIPVAPKSPPAAVMGPPPAPVPVMSPAPFDHEYNEGASSGRRPGVVPIDHEYNEGVGSAGPAFDHEYNEGL